MGYKSIGMAGSLEINIKPHFSFKVVISWPFEKEESWISINWKIFWIFGLKVSPTLQEFVWQKTHVWWILIMEITAVQRKAENVWIRFVSQNEMKSKYVSIQGWRPFIDSALIYNTTDDWGISFVCSTLALVGEGMRSFHKSAAISVRLQSFQESLL